MNFLKEWELLPQKGNFRIYFKIYINTHLFTIEVQYKL